MSKKKTIQEVVDLVETDGLAFALECGVIWGEIEDDKLRKLWREAELSYDRLSAYLDEHAE